jgi:hypothetical protein
MVTGEDAFRGFAQRMDRLVEVSRSELPAHRACVPLLWWKHFGAGSAGADLATRRGHNPLGWRSWVREIHAVVVEEGGEPCGALPMFTCEVLVERGRSTVPVLSTCPDSFLVFRQDVLAREDRRDDVIRRAMGVLAEHVEARRACLVLGHVTDGSPSLPGLRRGVGERLERGWVGGEYVIHARGGVYPWTVPALARALREVGSDTRAGPLAPCIDALVADLERWSASLRLLTGTREALLGRVKGVAASCDELGLPERAASIRRCVEPAPIDYPVLDLPHDLATFEAGLSASRRAFYRRYLRRFREVGGAFEVLERPSDDDVRRHLALHRERWGAESVAVREETTTFHEELSRAMAERGCLRLFFANVGGERVASLMCFDTGKRREMYYAGRETSERASRAGSLLTWQSIGDAIERGLSVYDFGYGGQEYKRELGGREQRVRAFVLAPSGPLHVDALFSGYESMNVSRQPFPLVPSHSLP